MFVLLSLILERSMTTQDGTKRGQERRQTEQDELLHDHAAGQHNTSTTHSVDIPVASNSSADVLWQSDAWKWRIIRQGALLFASAFRRLGRGFYFGPRTVLQSVGLICSPRDISLVRSLHRCIWWQLPRCTTADCPATGSSHSSNLWSTRTVV